MLRLRVLERAPQLNQEHIIFPYNGYLVGISSRTFSFSCPFDSLPSILEFSVDSSFLVCKIF